MWLDYAIVVISSLLPVILLADLGNAFYNDWTNHVWFIGYFGHFIHSHFRLPVAMNTTQVVGLVFPLFYGYSFYSIGGLLSNLVGSNVAVRLILAAVVVTVALQTYLTARTLSRSRPFALVLAFVVSSSPYQLTNIFSRGDFPEYVAGALILSGGIAWLRFALVNPPSYRAAWTAGFLYALGASVHPISALLGGVVCAVVFPATAYAGGQLRRTVLIGVPLVALIAMFLSPWMYAVLRYARQMNIVQGNVLLYFGGIDGFWNRIAPLPQDPRVTIAGVLATPFAYLDLQINTALIVLLVALGLLAFRSGSGREASNRRAIAVVAFLVVAAAVVVVASTIPSVGVIVFHPVAMMQFAYRSITYIDMMLLISVLLLAYVVRKTPGAMTSTIAMSGLFLAAALSFHSDIVKLSHSLAIEGRATVPGSGNPALEAGSVDSPPGLPVVVGGYYAAPGAFASDLPLAGGTSIVTVSLPVANGAHFGDVGSAVVSVTKNSLLRTNIEGFPWDALVVDGVPVPRSQTIVTSSGPHMSVPVSAGTHTLTYQLTVDRIWSWLRLVMVVAAIVLIFLIWYTDRRRPSSSEWSSAPVE